MRPSDRSRSRLSSYLDTYRTRLTNEYSAVRSQFSTTASKVSAYQSQKSRLNKSLPLNITCLQMFLIFVNFGLFSIYVALFGLTIAKVFTAINEDCLKVPPSYDVPPDRVEPNIVSGYECTGIRLLESDDYFQVCLLVMLTVAIGVQMFSSNLAFTGSVTLTVWNIKISIMLFVLSALLLMTFFLLDNPLKKGRQFLKYFGAYNRDFLIVMLGIAVTHVFSGFFSIILLVRWNSFVSDLNKANS